MRGESPMRERVSEMGRVRKEGWKETVKECDEMGVREGSLTRTNEATGHLTHLVRLYNVTHSTLICHKLLLARTQIKHFISVRFFSVFPFQSHPNL